MFWGGLEKAFESGKFKRVARKDFGWKKVDSDKYDRNRPVYVYLSKIFTNSRVSEDDANRTLDHLKTFEPPRESGTFYRHYGLARAMLEAYREPESALNYLLLYAELEVESGRVKDKLRRLAEYMEEMNFSEGKRNRKCSILVLYLGGVLSLLLDDTTENALRWLERYKEEFSGEILLYDSSIFLLFASLLGDGETSNEKESIEDIINEYRETHSREAGNALLSLRGETLNSLLSYFGYAGSIFSGENVPDECYNHSLAVKKLSRLIKRDCSSALLEAVSCLRKCPEQGDFGHFGYLFFRGEDVSGDYYKFDRHRPASFYLYKGISNFVFRGEGDVLRYIHRYLAQQLEYWHDCEPCRWIQSVGKYYCTDDSARGAWSDGYFLKFFGIGQEPNYSRYASYEGDRRRVCREINSFLDAIRSDEKHHKVFEEACKKKDLVADTFLVGFTIISSFLYNASIANGILNVDTLVRLLKSIQDPSSGGDEKKVVSVISFVFTQVFDVLNFELSFAKNYGLLLDRDYSKDTLLFPLMKALYFRKSLETGGSWEALSAYYYSEKEKVHPNYFCHLGCILPTAEISGVWVDRAESISGNEQDKTTVMYLGTDFEAENSKFLLAREYLRQYKRYIDKTGEYPARSEAIPFLTVMDLTIGSADGSRGKCLSYSGKVPEHYQSQIALRHLWKGLRYYELGRHEKSFKHFEKYNDYIEENDLEPYSYHFYYCYGDMNMKRRKYKEAAQSFDSYMKRIQNFRDAPPPLVLVAQDFAKLVGEQTVIGDYVSFLTRRESTELFGDTYYKLGTLYYHQKKYEKAIVPLKKASHTLNDDRKVEFDRMLMNCYSELRDLEGAVRTCQEIKDIKPEDLETIASLYKEARLRGKIMSDLSKGIKPCFRKLVEKRIKDEEWSTVYPFYTGYVIKVLSKEFESEYLRVIRENLQIDTSIMDCIPDKLPDVPIKMLIQPYFLLRPSSEYLLYYGSTLEPDESLELEEVFLGKCKELQKPGATETNDTIEIDDFVAFYRAVVCFETGKHPRVSLKKIDFEATELSPYLKSKFDEGLRTVDGVEISLRFRRLRKSKDVVNDVKEILRLVNRSDLPLDVKQQIRLTLILMLEERN